ncbi:hypothetical protein B0A52_02292 [Exophiala mesophila]|uniref:Transcription factor domain-containing protein n=1 Tax=Exophiala mesophila TaxID=212818 RepID=A0A438NBK5_EXOME|nr:hypothetical protein B0A52_02292 [Exophiala mesophila]
MSISEAPPLSSFISVSSASALSFVFSGSVANASPKRTNSLGCNMCITSSVHCHGYAQKLAWQSGLASRGKMTRKTFKIPADEDSANQTRKTRCPTTFAFVQENGIKRRKTKAQVHGTRRALEPTHRHPRDFTSPTVLSPRIPTMLEIDQDLEDHGTTMIEQSQQDVNGPIELPETPEFVESSTPSSPPVDQRDLVIHRQLTTFYPLHHHESEILDFYKWRFSSLPITFEMQVNPWQMFLPMAFESPCLLNAVFALGKKYRGLLMHEAEDLEALQFKNKSLNAFIDLVQDLTANPALLIATILALVSIDYIGTGYSNWSVHFRGAYQILQSKGGIAIADNDIGLQSQIAMLVWYDVSSALLSRREPVFPRSYTKRLMKWRLTSGWTMLALNGFPDDLLLVIYDLAWAASHPVDVEEVLKLERSLWTVQFETQDEDLARLFDCWRLSLLLYCGRVFDIQQTNLSHDPLHTFPVHRRLYHSDCSTPSSPAKCATPPKHLLGVEERSKFLAEEIFWLLRDITSTSSIQKQCLIPVTLAACEMDSDPERFPFRIMAEEYCRRWNRQSGHGVFTTALGLIEDVWRLIDRGFAVQDLWLAGISNPRQVLEVSTPIEESSPSWDALHSSREFLLG